jgi:ribosomal protein S6--L-glutamate ligase
MLDVKGGPRVFEVNSSPSIREAEQSCGIDAAARIVERAVALANACPRRRPRSEGVAAVPEPAPARASRAP